MLLPLPSQGTHIACVPLQLDSRGGGGGRIVIEWSHDSTCWRSILWRFKSVIWLFELRMELDISISIIVCGGRARVTVTRTHNLNTVTKLVAGRLRRKRSVPVILIIHRTLLLQTK